MILLLAAVVLLVGVAVASLVAARNRRRRPLEAAAWALRSRAEGLRYRLDALPADADEQARAEALRLVESAVATLSSARAHQSQGAIDEGTRTLDAAQEQIDRLTGRG